MSTTPNTDSSDDTLLYSPNFHIQGGGVGGRGGGGGKQQSAVQKIKEFMGYLGPGWMIAIGYLDPGNWAADLEAGSKFGYSLLFVILVSNFMAVALQTLCIKLGIITGMDLAQACKSYYRKEVNWFLYALAEIAIIATDVAEVIGTAIALKLLFGWSTWVGVIVTLADTLLILFGLQRAAKYLEYFIGILFAVVTACFVALMVKSQPPALSILYGCIPHEVWTPKMLYLSASVLGATVMPHNLYLHSSIVQERALKEPSHARAIKFSIIDLCSALVLALFVNAAILIVAASRMYQNESVADSDEHLFAAYDAIRLDLGKSAAVIFAVALFFAGQSSTITGTLTGQIVMEGFLTMSVRPWLRRLITRSLAVIPAVAICIFYGDSGLSKLLVGSQVILSLQLPFAVIPLIQMTRDRNVMGEDMAVRGWLLWTSILVGVAVIVLNIGVVVGTIIEASHGRLDF